MPDLNRAHLPEEFYDVTSTGLLIQPEPKYLHALLFKMAMNVGFNAQNEGLLGFIRDRGGFGNNGAAYQTDVEKGRLSLSDGIYDQAVQFVPELGKTPGHLVRINRPTFQDSTYDQASREVPASTTLSTTPQSLGSDQTSILLKRFGGPFHNASGEIRPIGVDRFDSSVSLHRFAQIVGLNLKRDFDKTLDYWGVKLFDNANTIVRPTGMVNDDTPAVAGDFPFSFSLFAAAERQMDDAHIPTFPNGKRAMVLHPAQCEQLSNDERFNKQSRFEPGMNPLFQGTYWKSVGMWDLFKSTTLTTVTNANSVPVRYAQAFGPGAVGAGMGDVPRVWNSTEDNYGQTAKVLWLWPAGFETLDNRFIARVTTS